MNQTTPQSPAQKYIQDLLNRKQASKNVTEMEEVFLAQYYQSQKKAQEIAEKAKSISDQVNALTHQRMQLDKALDQELGRAAGILDSAAKIYELTTRVPKDAEANKRGSKK